MPNYVTSQVTFPMDVIDTSKLREQAMLVSKLFEADSPDLCSRAIAAAMQGCTESALGILFILKDNKDQLAIDRVMNNVSLYDRNIFKIALAA